MATKYNSFSSILGAGILVNTNLPLDPRLVVEYKHLLMETSTWKGTGVYQGMLVSVLSEKQIYMYNPSIDTYDPTVEEYWVKVSGSGGDVDLKDVYQKIHDNSTAISNVSTDVSNLKFIVSNVSILVANVSTVLYDVSSRVDKLEINIVNVSNAIDDVSDRLSKFGKAFIYRGKGYYNSSVTPASDNYIVDVSGSTTVITGLRGGDVYQTSDNKEWVYVEEPTHAGEKWVELGLPFKFKHYINGSTNSEFVNVSTLSEDDTHTIVIVDVSKSILDSSNFEATGFVTDAQLKTALSWVVLD